MLKIDFPVGYKVRYISDLGQYTVSVPPRYTESAVNTIMSQDWVVDVYYDYILYVLVNEAYIATTDEIIAALGKLCQHVMGIEDTSDDNTATATRTVEASGQ